MKVYNCRETGKAAVCERCGQRKYNQAQVIDYGRYIADRLVAERRRKIDIQEFVKWQVDANLANSSPDRNIKQAVEKLAGWDGLRICSSCENKLDEAVRAILTT